MPVYMKAPGGRSKALTFSYDDGVEQDLRLIEILDAHKMKGTFNLNSGRYAPEGTVHPEGFVPRRMTEKMCAEAYKNHEVAIHGLKHPYLERISPEQATYEVMTDRINLEKLTGGIVRGMAYPYGTYNDTVVEILKNCGVAYARTVRATLDFKMPQDWLRLDPTCHHAHPDLMKIADRFLHLPTATKELQLFYLWGHAYEFEGDNNWEVIERFADKMADNDDIWYATNIEIYDYVQAFRQLQFNMEQTICYNPTATRLWFSFHQKIYNVGPGETLNI